MSEKKLLSISILVSNRIDTIEKTLSSIKPLLEAIPSELVIVDTVGEEKTDGSLDVAKKYADKIVHFDWIKDFAAARNAGLRECTGEWFMFMDDDEWFENVNEIIEFFLSKEYLKYESAMYKIRNYKDFDGKNYSEAEIMRLVKRTDNLRFKGCVHERLNRVVKPCKYLNSYVHHYGYVYKTEEERIAHIKRNREGLLKELEVNPEDLNVRCQVILELANYDNEGALNICLETLEICKNYNKEPGFQWIFSVIFRLYEALQINVEEAERMYREYKMKFSFNEAVDNAVCYEMTRMYLIANRPAEAIEYCDRYFETYDYLEANIDIKNAQTVADLITYTSFPLYIDAIEYAAYCHATAESFEKAWYYYGRMPWEVVSVGKVEALKRVFILADNYKDNFILFNIIKKVIRNPELKVVFGELMQDAWVKEIINDTLRCLGNK